MAATGVITMVDKKPCYAAKHIAQQRHTSAIYLKQYISKAKQVTHKQLFFLS